MSETEHQILDHLDAYKTAVFAKDVEAFVSLYDPDVRVFDMWGEWSYQGVAAWRRMVTYWFESLGSERVAVEFDGLQSSVCSELAVVHAFVTFTGTSAEGETLRAMRNRFSWALRKKGAKWQVIHEHSSAPVDFESMKVML